MIAPAPEARSQDLMRRLDPTRLPRHVAIIMDGNGRWAEQRRFGRIRGHRAGVKAIRHATNLAARVGIPFLTLFAFSTENWSRPKDEVEALWQLLLEYLEREVPRLVRQDVRLQTIGDIQGLPPEVRRKLEWARQATGQGDKLQLILALNYGSRDEIVAAVRRLAKASPGKAAETIDTVLFSKHLDTAQFPDPDLLIRTSGERRLSNFLLWQLSYAELCFLDVLWPDFNRIHFLNALLDYQGRQRRFGGVR